VTLYVLLIYYLDHSFLKSLSIYHEFIHVLSLLNGYVCDLPLNAVVLVLC